MLILSRKPQEEIKIGEAITIKVIRISGSRVTLGVQTPDAYKILRGELQRRLVIEKKLPDSDLQAG